MANKNDKKKVSKIKIKKKTWFKIVAPKVFGNKEVGESYLTNADSAVGRRLKVNLKDLTDNVKDQNTAINFRITNVSANLLNTTVIGYQLVPAYIKRLVRKNTNKIEDYLRLKTKGGVEFFAKTLVITLHKAQRSTRAQLKKDMAKLLEEEASRVDFATFITSLVNHRTQIGIKKKLNKVFPLKEVAIRVLELKDQKATEKEEITVEDKSEVKEQPQKQPVEEAKVEEVKEVTETKESEPAGKETSEETPVEEKEE
jgi:small subunit ribosomal protein S3Ae